MAYRGRYQLGTDIPLSVLTVNGSNTPSFPSAAPTVEVWSATGKVFSGRLMPVLDRYAQTGLFAWRLFLDGRFSPGQYTAVYRWKVGTFQGVEADTFEVAAGGSGDGAVISMFWYARPQANFVVMQLSSGKLVKGRNPRV